MFCEKITFDDVYSFNMGMVIGVWLTLMIIGVCIAFFQPPQEDEKKIYTYRQNQFYECSALKEGLILCRLKH